MPSSYFFVWHIETAGSKTADKMVNNAKDDLHDNFLRQAIVTTKNKSYQQNIYHALSWFQK